MKKLGKTIAIIECRMTSSRLPGKVLMPALNKPLLELLCERVKRVDQLDEIVLATTTNKTDNPIVDLAEKINVSVFRGSELDVLGRVSAAAIAHSGNTCLSITGDCPLIDPEILSQLIELYRINDCDRVECNLPDKSLYPDGLGAHIQNSELLKEATKRGKLPNDREHVVWYFRRHPEEYRTITLPPQPSVSHPEFQITLDEPKDYELIKKIYEDLYPVNPEFTAREIIDHLIKNPDISKINTKVKRVIVRD